MKLYLARHGDYVTDHSLKKDVLTEQGVDEIKRIAAFLASANITIDKIYHSEKNRARETAAIYASALLVDDKPQTLPGIQPQDNIKSLIKMIPSWNKDTLIVGHLPFMEKMIARLFNLYDTDQPMVLFAMGSIVCLETNNLTGWGIRWVLHPSLFGR